MRGALVIAAAVASGAGCVSGVATPSGGGTSGSSATSSTTNGVTSSAASGTSSSSTSSGSSVTSRRGSTASAASSGSSSPRSPFSSGTSSVSSSRTSGSSSTGGTSGGLTGGYAPAGYRLIFDDELDTLSLWSGDAGTWQTTYPWGDRTNNAPTEAEVYMDPGYAGSCSAPLGVNPFSLDGGILSITAAPISAADQPCLSGFAYTSGILTTYPSFSFTYGYAEMRALLPAGQGLWPAFWTLPQSQAWPPEIDIFEFLGQAPTTLEMHIHSNFGTYGQTSTVPDTSQAFHVYGLDWEGDDVTWYFDGVQQAQAATPSYPDLLADAGATNVPMYVLINLAVGGQGSWPGPPDSSTVFPAVMQIDWVRVYQKP